MATRSDLSGGISLRFTAAVERARELAERPYGDGRPAPLPHPMRRVRAVGAPRTSLERFLAVLDAHDLLGVDGFLADDVQLVSTGDHFDYAVHDHSDPGADGIAILRWLAEHAPTQAAILLGRHDAARVIELAGLGDPVTDAQRRLVIALLRAGRFRGAVAAILADDRPVLITHGGVTARDVASLGAAAEPKPLAAALDRRLADAVGARRDDWAAGRITPLELPPVEQVVPRDLPRGLVQACGRWSHAACKADLAPWATEAARDADHGVLRTLVVDGDQVVYDLGIAGVGGAVAVLHLIDAGLNAPDLEPAHVPLLELAALSS